VVTIFSVTLDSFQIDKLEKPMNTPLREAIQGEMRIREARRAASTNERSPERSPRLEFDGIRPEATSQGPFQAEPPSAPQGQGLSEKGHGASGDAEVPPRFPGHPLTTTRSGGREIATARTTHRPQGKRGAGRKLTERDKELAGFLGVTRYLSREQ